MVAPLVSLDEYLIWSTVFVGTYLQRFHRSHRLEVFPAVRLAVAPRRHRIPDILVLETPYQHGEIVTGVPIVTVEINILILDPGKRPAWLFEQNNLPALPGTSVELTLSYGAIHFPFAEMFAELDEQ